MAAHRPDQTRVLYLHAIPFTRWNAYAQGAGIPNSFTYHTAYINTLGRRCYKILTKLKFHLYPLVNQPWMLILLATVKKTVVCGGVEVGGKDTRTTPYPMFFTYSGSYPQ